MPTWKGAPAIMQQMMVCLRADRYGNKLVSWCSCFRLTARYQIGSRSAYGILEDVGQE